MRLATGDGVRARVVWAPSPANRLRAVRSEMETLVDITEKRMLTKAELRYREHLTRREEELLDEMRDERLAQARSMSRQR